MKKWAMLLKGVNVGGNRKLPMADLRQFLKDLGYTDVKTLLASGNAVFSCDESDGAQLETLLEREAKAKLALDTDILVRDAADLAAILKANPFADAAVDHPSHLLVYFHRDRFPVELIDALALVYQGPERRTAIGRELFIDFPENIGDSKLPQAMARARFPKLVTARNWNTVNKLAAMLSA
ncbi:DUF1697 domain-containing protein [soil metagenome]